METKLKCLADPAHVQYEPNPLLQIATQADVTNTRDRCSFSATLKAVKTAKPV
jgi:hypothetical protein